MVQLTTLFAIIALSSTAFSHPLNRRKVGKDALLKNAQEAQKLNAEFKTLKATDPCNNGDVACVESALALCISGKWDTQSCPASLQCFALPDVNKNGITIGCTNAKTAEGLISSSGAQGAIDSPVDANSTSTGASTVTVTVTAGDTQTSLPSTSTTDATTTTSTGAATTNAPVAGAVNAGSGTTIILSGASSSTEAAPAATSPAKSGVQGGIVAPPVAAVAATTILLNDPAAATTAPTPAPAPAAPPAAAAPPYAGY